MSEEIRQKILQVISEVPFGRVVTYGQVARLAGYPNHSRFVSKAMGKSDHQVNWHRVLNSQGKSSMKGTRANMQFDRLAEEGVEAVLGKVDLSLYQWDPVFDGMMTEWSEAKHDAP